MYFALLDSILMTVRSEGSIHCKQQTLHFTVSDYTRTLNPTVERLLFGHSFGYHLTLKVTNFVT